MAVSGSLLLTAFFVSSQNAFSLVGLPLLLKEGLLTETEMGILLGAYPLASAVSALCAGIVSDYYGRRRILIIGHAVFAIALLSHPLSISFAGLLAARLVSGLAAGLLVGLPSTYASDHFKHGALQRVLSRNLLGYALGHAIGLPLGIAILELVHFTELTGWLGLACIATWPSTLRNLPSYRPRETAKSARLWNFHSTWTAIRARQSRTIALQSFGAFFSSALFQTSVALWMFDQLQLTASALASMFLIGGLGQCLIFMAVTPRLDAIGSSKTIALSLALQASLFFCFPLASDYTLAAWLFASSLVASALRIPSWHSWIATDGDARHKGLRMSLCQTANLLGKSAGALVAGLLYSLLGAKGLTPIAGLILLGLATSWFLSARPLTIVVANQATPHDV